MKDDCSGEHVHKQQSEQGSEIPLREQLSVGISQDSDRNGQQQKDVSRLEKGVERTTKLMSFLTALVSAATIGSSIVAYLQWQTAKIQFRQDQRPYVMPHTADSTFLPDQRIMVNFRIGNYGKSPAIESGGAGKVFFGDDAFQQADRWFKDELPQLVARRNKTILPPNMPASNPEARDTTVLSDKPVSGDELNALLSRSFSIVAVMRQVYRDTAGNEYWTDSCVSNLVNSFHQMRIVECSTHNHVE